MYIYIDVFFVFCASPLGVHDSIVHVVHVCRDDVSEYFEQFKKIIITQRTGDVLHLTRSLWRDHPCGGNRIRCDTEADDRFNQKLG